MLTSGTLGPAQAWDRRLAVARPDSTLALDRATFELSVTASSHAFHPAPLSSDAHERRLRQAVEGAVSDMDVRTDEWALALSGGMDSRSLLYHLPKDPDLLTITWGLQESMAAATSDAAVAARLANENRVPHMYFDTDADAVPFAVTMDRFLTAGDGRVDHISGYMDGLDLWRRLAELGRDVIRGYDALGSKWPVSSARQARSLSGFRLAMDYQNHLIPEQMTVGIEDIPADLARQGKEMLDDYRDRLWLEFRTPFLTAALDDIKAAYVEICNPLLFRRVVDVIRELPPRLRSHKRVFEKIVSEMYPGIPFAKYVSTESVEDIVRRTDVRDYLVTVLENPGAQATLPGEFLSILVSDLQKPNRSGTGWQKLLDRIAFS